MAELILHHYDISPYAEKIRLAFGLKGLAWASVIVPATLPKPDLMPLTGGFRRTPVLQIGADIYCDTLRIAMELDRRCPEPPLLPESGGGAGFDGILATWAERVLMWPTARYVTGMNRDALPEAFFRDRAEMRGHPVPTRDEVAAGLPHEEGQLHLMLGWVEDLLAGERRFASGRLPRLADLALYQRLWWLKALDGRAAHALDDFPRTRDWVARIAAVGHGERSELSPREALRIASEAEPDDPPRGAPGEDPALRSRSRGRGRGRGRGGDRVRVATEDFARDPVEGELVHASRETIAIRRDDPEVGRVHVHFPRLGYAVTPA